MAVKTTSPASPEIAEPDPTPENVENKTPEPDYNNDDFTFVRFPDGTVRAVPNADIMRSGNNGGLTNLEGPPPGRDESEVYLHLADGSVEKVKAYEVPPAAGTNFPNGFFTRDDKTYQVIGVYPAETTAAQK